jgi:hypothetical protein
MPEMRALSVLAVVASLSSVAVGCARKDAPSAPATAPPATPSPPPPPPPVVHDAGADVPDAGTGAVHRAAAKKPARPPGAGANGGFKVEGTLTKVDAEKVVRAGYSTLRACNSNLKGKVSFRLTVDDRGRVSLGEVLTSTLDGADTEMCMIRATRDLKFPATAGESKVNFQMSF